MSKAMYRYIHLGFLLLVLSLGNHHTAHSNTHSYAKYHYSHIGKFDLSKYGLRTKVTSPTQLPGQEIQTLPENNLEEEFESHSSRRSDQQGCAFVWFYDVDLGSVLHPDQVRKVSHSGNILLSAQVGHNILYQVFRI